MQPHDTKPQDAAAKPKKRGRRMPLRQRYRQLTFWNRVSFWGSVASLIALLITLAILVFGGNSQPTTTGNQSPVIEDVKGDVNVHYK